MFGPRYRPFLYLQLAETKVIYQAAKKEPPQKSSTDLTFEDFQTVLNQLRKYKIAILLDEFDNIFKYPEFNQSFLEGLRSLIVGRQLAWVTASYRDLYELGKTIGLSAGSPFYNIFNSRIYLSGMASEDAEELVSVPAKTAGRPFSGVDIAWIIENAGTMPAFIQKASASLFETRLHDGERNTTLIQARQDFTKWATNHYQNYWDKFNLREKEVLGRLAKIKTKETKNNLVILGDLEKYGLVNKEENSYTINGSVFKDWISHQS